MADRKPFLLRIDPAVLDAVQRWANDDLRSLNAQIEFLLRRAAQQAGAIIAARQRIVEGAVGMVEMALQMLSHKGIVTLDEERKAAMVSNLLVVLCGDRNTQPVINTGTIYQ